MIEKALVLIGWAYFAYETGKEVVEKYVDPSVFAWIL